MILADFKCSNCGKIIEVYKQSIEDDFPSFIKCTFCNSLETYRIWNIVDIDVCEGKVGNGKNGFQKSFAYHPSAKTGKLKGKTIKEVK